MFFDNVVQRVQKSKQRRKRTDLEDWSFKVFLKWTIKVQRQNNTFLIKSKPSDFSQKTKLLVLLYSFGSSMSS